jgi:glycosyltransferase involved in cell wall biosynthesis
LRPAVRRELGIPAEAIVLAHVARVNPMKDHECFLEAMAGLPDLRALLIGADTEDLPDRPNLLRLGRRDDVERLLPAADVVVSSSAFGEGFSNALAEGMACGLPAISTDVGDNAIVVGDTGAVVPPRDPQTLASAIRALADEEPAAHADRSRRARARIVEQFSLARSIARWSESYAAILSPSAR